MNKNLPLSGAATAALAAILLFGNAGQALAATSFTRDLTLGSSGNDVSELQNLLIKNGFAIPAGATGYFGAQTKASLASYQAVHSIVPAAGYFGPVTRSAMSSSTSVDTGSNGNTSTDTGSLSGGEASLRSFKLTAGDDIAEGDTNVEAATAKFDVRGGDVRVQRVTVELTGQDTSLNLQPWRYVDTLSIYNGSKKVGSVNADSKNDWDKSGNTYSIDIPVSTIVKGGKDVELSIRVDAQSSIDSANLNQTFELVIPDDGIRAVDAAGIQQYIGKDGSSVALGFEGEDNGKLTVRESSDNPEASMIIAETGKTSDKADVLAFEVRNGSDVDVDLTDLTIRVDGTFATGSVSGEDVDDIIRRATLKIDGKSYQGTVGDTDSGSYEGAITFKNLKTVIGADDTVDATLTIDLYGSNNHYDQGATLSFDLLAGDIEAESDRSGDSTEVTGTVTGNPMTITTDAGITVRGRTAESKSMPVSSTISSSYGTYMLKFDVTAVGDSIFVPRTVAVNGDVASTTGVGVIVTGEDMGTTSAAITSTAKTYDADFYIVHEGDTETFTINVIVDPNVAGYYAASLDLVRFSNTASTTSLFTFDVDQNGSQFRTDPVYIPN